MATGGINLRSPYPPPSHPEVLSLPAELRLIWLRHPGYPDDRNLLFSFPSSDEGGIHHETARLACAIIAGNRWDGFLCEDKEGHRRVTAGQNEALRELSYYFHLPGARNERYAITPTFYHWTFPHNDLPKHWKDIESTRTATASPREPSSQSCRMTLNEESVENAHLIPAAQQPWFYMNQMAVYTTSTGMDKMKDTNNTIRLRSDVHTIFDAKRFTIVPKQGVFVAHTFNEVKSEVLRLYHNVQLHYFEASVPLLFARFAYTIFECLRTSLESGQSRKLRLRVEEGMAEKECTGSECAVYAMETAMQSKSRSASPKKRQKPQKADNLALEEDETTDEEECRGRKRWRTGESWSSSNSFVSTYCSEDESVKAVREMKGPVGLDFCADAAGQAQCEKAGDEEDAVLESKESEKNGAGNLLSFRARLD